MKHYYKDHWNDASLTVKNQVRVFPAIAFLSIFSPFTLVKGVEYRYMSMLPVWQRLGDA